MLLGFAALTPTYPWNHSVFLRRGLAPLLADDRFFARIDDRLHHAVHVGNAFVKLELAGELAVRVQFAQFEQRPPLLAVVGIQQFRRDTRQEIGSASCRERGWQYV